MLTSRIDKGCSIPAVVWFGVAMVLHTTQGCSAVGRGIACHVRLQYSCSWSWCCMPRKAAVFRMHCTQGSGQVVHGGWIEALITLISIENEILYCQSKTGYNVLMRLDI